MKLESIGLFGKYLDAGVRDTIDAAREILERHGARVLLGDTTAPEIAGARLEEADLPLDQAIDLAVVVGGDGTLLHVARSLAEHRIPVVGINLGRLGFLTDIPAHDMEEELGKIFAGRYRLENRSLLRTEVWREDDLLESSLALNDAVVSAGSFARLIEFEIRVNGEFVTNTRGDGIIVSTPTGSTAYALAAGGPILYPTLPVMLLVPICPHTLSNRPIVLDENSVIEICSLTRCETSANLAADGIVQRLLKGDELLRITKAEPRLQLVRVETHTHFETLRNKLGWSG